MKVTFWNGSSSTTVTTAPQIISGGAALPPGAEGQVLGYGPGGVLRALDAAGPPYDDTGIKQRVQTLESTVAGKADVGHGHAVSAITGLQGALDGKASASHGHAMAEITGLQTALDGKAAASAIPTTEFLQDLIAAMFQGGTHTNASISYDDNAGTLNITAVGGSGGAAIGREEVEDFVGGLVVQGTGVNVTYDDAGNVLRIALSGESFTTADKTKLAAIAAGATANQTDAHLLARGNHTGTQAIATIAGLQAVIDDLTARIVALEAGTVVTPPGTNAPDAVVVDDTSSGFILHA